MTADINIKILKEINREIVIHDLIERTHECELIWSQLSPSQYRSEDLYTEFLITNTGTQYVLEVFKEGRNRLTLLSSIYSTVKQLYDAIHYVQSTRDNHRREFINRLLGTGSYCALKKWEFGRGGVVVGGRAIILAGNEKGTGGVVVGGIGLVGIQLLGSGGIVVGGEGLEEYVERSGGVVCGGISEDRVIDEHLGLGGVVCGSNNALEVVPVTVVGGMVCGGEAHVTSHLGVGGVVCSAGYVEVGKELWFAKQDIFIDDPRISYCDLLGQNVEEYFAVEQTYAPAIDAEDRYVFWCDRLNNSLYRATTNGLGKQLVASFPGRFIDGVGTKLPEYDPNVKVLGVVIDLTEDLGIYRVYLMDRNGGNIRSFDIDNTGETSILDLGIHGNSNFIYILRTEGSLSLSYHVDRYNYTNLTLDTSYVVNNLAGLEIDRLNNLIFYFRWTSYPDGNVLLRTDLGFSTSIGLNSELDLRGIGLDERNGHIYMIYSTGSEWLLKRIGYDGGDERLLFELTRSESATGIGMNLPLVPSTNVSTTYVPASSGGIILGGSAVLSGVEIPLLYMTNASDNRIEILTSETHDAVPLVLSQNNCDDIIVDLIYKKLYWTNTDEAKIKSSNLNGTGLRTVWTVPQPVGPQLQVKGLCLDDVLGRIYYCVGNSFSGTKQIRRVSTLGTGDTLVTNTGLEAQRVKLGLDDCLYYTSSDAALGNIVRYDLNTNISTLLMSGASISNVRGIALDFVSGHIYFCRDSASNKLMRMDLNGSNLAHISSHPWIMTPDDLSLDLVNRVIYMANSGMNNILTISMDYPYNVSWIYAGDGSVRRGITLVENRG